MVIEALVRPISGKVWKCMEMFDFQGPKFRKNDFFYHVKRGRRT
jgi:hypothetical protein